VTSLIAADEVAESKSGADGPDAGGPPQQKAIEGRTPLQLAWARLKKDKVSLACIGVILLLIVIAILAGPLSSLIGHPPNQQYRDEGLQPNGLPVAPGGFFLLGGDELGRDVLVRIIYGARVSLLVGVVATALAVIIGVVIGTMAGYFGGKVDTFLSRTMDVFLSFPFLLFAISLVSVFDPSVKISIFVIAFFVWANVGRIVRGQVLSIREKEYVEAARSLGAGDLRIMAVDVLPNLVAPIIVYSTLLIPTSIVFEATLSFLGLGVPIPTPTWGNMIAGSQATYLQAPWYLFFPSLALFITTLAFNLLGDGLRDALDPRAARVLARK
jgi:peptide/nickel transport system permease protein